MKMFAKHHSVCLTVASSITTTILVLALNVPKAILSRSYQLFAITVDPTDARLSFRRTRVLNLWEICRKIRFEARRDDPRTSNYDPE